MAPLVRFNPEDVAGIYKSRQFHTSLISAERAHIRHSIVKSRMGPRRFGRIGDLRVIRPTNNHYLLIPDQTVDTHQIAPGLNCECGFTHELCTTCSCSRCRKRCPHLHQRSSLFKQVTAKVRGLCFILDHMSERRFGDSA